MRRLNGSAVVDDDGSVRVAATGYLDQAGKLPTCRLELFFLLKRALAHVVKVAASTISSSEGVRDGAVILARCLRAAAAVADALAETEPTDNPARAANREQNRMPQ